MSFIVLNVVYILLFRVWNSWFWFVVLEDNRKAFWDAILLTMVVKIGHLSYYRLLVSLIILLWPLYSLKCISAMVKIIEITFSLHSDIWSEYWLKLLTFICMILCIPHPLPNDWLIGYYAGVQLFLLKWPVRVYVIYVYTYSFIMSLRFPSEAAKQGVYQLLRISLNHLKGLKGSIWKVAFFYIFFNYLSVADTSLYH